MKQLILAAALAIGIASTGSVAATGIPVVDVASLANDTANQAANIAKYIKMIQQYKTQIDQMKHQYEALTGSRGLGMIANDPELRNYLPEDWQTVYDKVAQGGYSGLSGSAQAILDANAIFNMCADKLGDAKRICERSSSKAAQDKAFAVEAFESAKDRFHSSCKPSTAPPIPKRLPSCRRASTSNKPRSRTSRANCRCSR